MGGSSAQISFYKPEQDILAGLFKLQLGGRSHINIYAHSFLHYGRVSSRRAYWEYLAKKAGCWTYDGDDPQAAVRARRPFCRRGAVGALRFPHAIKATVASTPSIDALRAGPLRHRGPLFSRSGT